MGCSTGWSLGCSSCSGRLYSVWRVTISSGGISNGLRNGESLTKCAVVDGEPGTDRAKRGDRQGENSTRKMFGDLYDSMWLKALGSCFHLSAYLGLFEWHLASYQRSLAYSPLLPDDRPLSKMPVHV